MLEVYEPNVSKISINPLGYEDKGDDVEITNEPTINLTLPIPDGLKITCFFIQPMTLYFIKDNTFYKVVEYGDLDTEKIRDMRFMIRNAIILMKGDSNVDIVAYLDAMINL